MFKLKGTGEGVDQEESDSWRNRIAENQVLEFYFKNFLQIVGEIFVLLNSLQIVKYLWILPKQVKLENALFSRQFDGSFGVFVLIWSTWFSINF